MLGVTAALNFAAAELDLTDGHRLATGNRAYDRLLRGLRWQGERGFAILIGHWNRLRHTTASPRTIGDIVAAALHLTPLRMQIPTRKSLRSLHRHSHRLGSSRSRVYQPKQDASKVRQERHPLVPLMVGVGVAGRGPVDGTWTTCSMGRRGGRTGRSLTAPGHRGTGAPGHRGTGAPGHRAN
jgi:hypothetical protein